MTEYVEVVDNAIVFNRMVQNLDQRKVIHIEYKAKGMKPGDYSLMMNDKGEIASHQSVLKTLRAEAGENSQDATSGKIPKNVLASLVKNLPGAS